MAATRRLAAIMFTDLVGYTSRAQRDEPRTMRLLGEHRKIVRDVLVKFEGREVKTLGDGFLVEFGSALNATLCALELQQQSAEWVGESREDRPQLRVALHMGDVLSEEGDILGDAVNVASRIESLVEPGGICVSGPVYEQVRNKVPCAFEKLPSVRLRGVDVPPEIYRVVTGADPSARDVRTAPPARIAVLPFSSISPVAGDEYLADGLTEELISTLSQLGGLRVIARTSVDVYKNRPKPVPQIGAELNVRSLLEGSVRRMGNRVRVTAQLIDVLTQEHLWAGTYDRDLDDVFGIQGEIARAVAENLEVTVLDQEKRRLLSRPTGITESYLAYLKGRTLLHGMTQESPVEAQRQFELAVRLDPNNARAYSGLADAVYLGAKRSGRSVRHFIDILQVAREQVSRSILLDPSAAEAHASLGYLLVELLEFAEADRELRTAILLNPSYAAAHQSYARLLTEKGRLEEAVEEMQLAEAADPLSPGIQFQLADLFFALGRPADATQRIRRLSELEPDSLRNHLAGFEGALRSGDHGRLKEEAAWITGHPPVLGSEHLRSLWNGKYLAAAGDVDGARQEIARLRSLRDHETGEISEWVPGEIAEICALLNEPDECFLWLDQALQSIALPLAHWWLSSGFRTVRKDPRFREILKKARLL
ncbi:MAG TPA: adenylate/guanylate cyclase domain-containing protein [Thermoplasmata archaeon]|nr:adenylate/guanylate cyclase domain-containing protein [Thermoplasmata archaeon]